MWEGSAAICINDENKLLMVLQGAKNEDLKWSIPSGRKIKHESFEECCIREVREETGFIVKIISQLFEKKIILNDKLIIIKYFRVSLIGGSLSINDPDDLIHDIQWKAADEINELDLSFPEDRITLLKLLNFNEQII